MQPQSCLQIVDVSPPKVFISSTFTDPLVAIREDIRRHLEEVNYLPLMSELGSFSYQPYGRVYDSTVAAVPTCQVYVLIIGDRHGTVHPAKGTTITELEYEAARASGRPIFVYIQDRVWQGFLARGWAEFDPSEWVDDPRVFDFVERVCVEHAQRQVSFTEVRDLLSDFSAQLANLLGGYLRFQAKASSWLWSEEFTRSVEREAQLIWVLTPDFFWDYSDAEYREIVFCNVCERDTKYFYLFSDTERNRERVEEMGRDYAAEIGERWRQFVYFAPVPPQNFNWCTEQVLYDPGDPRNEHGIIVDAMNARSASDKYNIRLGREKLSEFRKQFARLWARYGEGPLAGAGGNAE